MTGSPLRELLAARLTAAMKSRDVVAVAALRTALGELGNQEAVAVPDVDGTAADRHFAGSRSGLYAAEAVRGKLSPSEEVAVLRALADSWEQSAVAAEAGGHGDAADQLRGEAAVLNRILAEQAGGPTG